MVASRVRERLDEHARKSELTRLLLDTPRAKKLIHKWDNEQYQKLVDIYEGEIDDIVRDENGDPVLGKNGKPRRIERIRHTDPPRYKDMDEALSVLVLKSRIALAQKQEMARTAAKLTVDDCVEILLENIAFTVNTHNKDVPSLLTYDYDRHVYTYSEAILTEYVVTILDTVTRSQMQTIVMSLLGNVRRLAAFVPLPDYKIAVGNGTFNCLTNELEDDDPRYIVTEKIDTKYQPGSYDPELGGNAGSRKTFAKLCNELANHEPDRTQLIQQICKAIVTGHSVSDALFIILGRGGDGKSTFFQMIINTIGQSNCGFVNFEEMKEADKMAETINKKLVIGMDNNVNEYIRKTSQLKSIASHEYITHSRKYERAVSVKFSGTFVQLCNEMPRFAETGDSMRRRLVCFHAENSHYKMGTEDRSLSKLIDNPDFKEHVLSEILDENRCAYYKDFNDIDRDYVTAVLDNEDILSQFADEMTSIGVLSEANTHIPASHLYAVYRKWTKDANPSASHLSAPSFIQRISKQMYAAGYDISQELKDTTPSSLVKAKQYSRSIFSTYAESEELLAAEEANAVTQIFVRTHDPVQLKQRRRGAVRCSALEYFGVYNEFLRWLRSNDYELYEALQDPVKKAEFIDPSIVKRDDADDVQPKIAPPTVREKKTENERREREKLFEYKRSIKPPHDIRRIFSTNDTDALGEFKQWLMDMKSMAPASTAQNILLMSIIESTGSYLKQIAKDEKDNELSQIADSMSSSSGNTSITYAIDFVDELLPIMNRRKSSDE